MIRLEHVSKDYLAGSGLPALNDVNMKIEDGEFVFIVGDSGSGKSTLIKLLLKELEPTSGTIVINGRKLNKIRRRQIPKFRREIGVVFQDFRLLKDRNVYNNVAFAQKVIGESTRMIRCNVPNILSKVGLAAKYRSYPRQLSGGEQQRVAIARALINRPKILLADEPTGNLDAQNSMEIMHLLEEINERGTMVIVVTHSEGKTGDLVTVNVPAGIDDGQTFIIRGEGDHGTNGGPAGDLQVTVTVRPDPIFERDGRNIWCDIPLTYTQAVLGDEIVVPTVDGKVKYTVPEGTQNGTVFRLRDKGVVDPNTGRNRGDQYVRVSIEVPKGLTRSQKEKLREFEQSLSEKNYHKRQGFFEKLREAFDKDK